jgi:hypothetical protein
MGSNKSSSEETRILWTQFQSLLLCDEVLYRQFYRADGTVSHLQFVLPTSLRSSFLHHIHDTGGNVATTHLGVKKTQNHVQLRAYWVNWTRDVEKFCRRCIVCQSVQQGPAPRQGTLQCYEATGPWDRIHVDLTGPHSPSRQGAVYILTVLDAFTRYLIVVPLKYKSALTVAEALVQNVFLPFGSCHRLVSNRGLSSATSYCRKSQSCWGFASCGHRPIVHLRMDALNMYIEQ